MCLGVPGVVLAAAAGSDLAQVDVAGRVRQVNVAMLNGPVVPGDHVIVHSGFALERLSPEDAAEALSAFVGSDPDDWLGQMDVR